MGHHQADVLAQFPVEAGYMRKAEWHHPRPMTRLREAGKRSGPRCFPLPPSHEFRPKDAAGFPRGSAQIPERYKSAPKVLRARPETVRLNATQGLIAVASFRPDYALNYE
ncbi:hypothetical protein DK47_3148 [Brucella abortus 2308]|nr:hypothetical protein DK47_3148 [Brucella abortus 2308]